MIFSFVPFFPDSIHTFHSTPQLNGGGDDFFQLLSEDPLTETLLVGGRNILLNLTAANLEENRDEVGQMFGNIFSI